MDEYLPPKSRSKKDRFFDAIFGLVLFYFLNITLGIIIAAGFKLARVFPMYFPVAIGLLLLLNIAVIGSLFKRGKRYVALGMIAGLLLPLLIAGSCFGVFSVIK